MNWLLEMLVSKYLNIDSCGKILVCPVLVSGLFWLKKKITQRLFLLFLKFFSKKKHFYCDVVIVYYAENSSVAQNKVDVQVQKHRSFIL